MTSRLSPHPDQWIDQSRPVEFRFEGRTYRGFDGDSLSSALWANGVRLMGRSFKYHRPRSIYTMTGYDANVIVESADQTNLRGDLLSIELGLDVKAVNAWGGLERDRYRWVERFSKFLPVGFYYKAFHKPQRLFPFFERQMRKAAGLGRINVRARTTSSPKEYDFCELLVVGAGPSGLAAAIAAAETGVDVLLVDENRRPGGSLCWQRQERAAELGQLLARAESLSTLRVRANTAVGGWYADQWAALFDGRRMTKLRAQATIVAAGAIEQPAVFQNNDLPGVMLGSAAQRLIRLYGVRPFARAVVLAANDEAYGVALDLAEAGCGVAAIVDLRPTPADTSTSRAVKKQNIPVYANSAVYEAISTRNAAVLEAVLVRSLDAGGNPLPGSDRRIPCDGLAVSVGWTPNSGIASQAGVRFGYSESVEQLIPRSLSPGVFVAGRANGIYSLDGRLADGRHAGLAASNYLGRQVDLPAKPEPAGPPPSHPFAVFAHPGKKNFVDFDEDIHLQDIVNARQEGFDNVELLKRYSTYGMGPSQGKLSNSNTVRILARLNDKTVEQTGTTTARPFHMPVSIAQLAGRRFHPHRHTPMDGWHRRQGAHMIHVGAWFRPEYYPARGLSRENAVLQEARAVRRGVGLIDISTLAKLHVSGPQACEFLERLYTGKFQTQKAGTSRYALACDESGVVIEEGIVVRLASDRFYVTASTAGGEAFYREMQRWALLWQMNVSLANVTGHWAAMNVAGPNARSVLQPLTSISLTAEDFPPGEARQGNVAGADALVMRSAFLGELSYEIHLPAFDAMHVWTQAINSGAAHGIRPFGTEAQRLLRLEKGHLIGGHDTDALTTPFEAGLERAVKMDKRYFVGKRSLEILARKPQTRRLVGIGFPASYAGPFPEECQLIIHNGDIAGRVTSLASQSMLGRGIGLAFVRPDLAAPGTPLRIQVSNGRFAHAAVEALPFYDPQDSRQT